MTIKVKRIKTGIKGLDPLIGGGIPEGYCVLLSGSVGTLKSIIAMEFLINGYLKSKQKGLFITFEESKDNLFMQANQFGIDLKKIHKDGKIIIETMPMQEAMNESLVIKKIEEAIKENKIKRIVIDSLDTYANNIIAFEDSQKQLPDTLWIKRAIYSFIKKLQKYDKVTKILIAEVDEKSDNLSRDEVSEFLCDGVIKIQYASLGGGRSRRLTVRKMRSTNNNPDSFPIEVTSKGIIIDSKKK